MNAGLNGWLASFDSFVLCMLMNRIALNLL
jgi:hypothetical protein